jgi:hypothetical protein
VTPLLQVKLTWATCALAAFACTGCSESEFVTVTGNVTWNGAPMPVGEVIFFPADNRTSPSAGKIEQGAFEFETKPGPMRVEIQAARETGEIHPTEGYKLTELYVPARYNSESELTADVTRDGDNHFTFDLKE